MLVTRPIVGSITAGVLLLALAIAVRLRRRQGPPTVGCA
jgi:MYXO-CTERM domain-containing protein